MNTLLRTHEVWEHTTEHGWRRLDGRTDYATALVQLDSLSRRDENKDKLYIVKPVTDQKAVA